MEAESEPSRQEVDSRNEIPARQTEVGREESVTHKVVEALVLLDGRTRAIRARLEQIVARMGELKEDERVREALAVIRPGKIQDKPGLAISGHKCKMGRVILMLGILGILAPVESAGTEEPKARRKLVYDSMQGLLEGVAMWIKEKQAEIKEMDRNMSIKKMELSEPKKTVRRRQMLLDFTSKEIEEGLRKLEMEKETVIAPEGQARKGARMLGLQVMGVFTLCGLLATLGWGGE